MQDGLAPGLLVLALGVFLVARTVTKDDTGRTLIDRILGNPGTLAGGIGGGDFTSGSGVTGRPGSKSATGDLPHGAPGSPTRPGRGASSGYVSPPTHDLPHGAARR